MAFRQHTPRYGVSYYTGLCVILYLCIRAERMAEDRNPNESNKHNKDGWRDLKQLYWSMILKSLGWNWQKRQMLSHFPLLPPWPVFLTYALCIFHLFIYFSYRKQGGRYFKMCVAIAQFFRQETASFTQRSLILSQGTTPVDFALIFSQPLD